jgi:hypothetical protein
MIGKSANSREFMSKFQASRANCGAYAARSRRATSTIKRVKRKTTADAPPPAASA